jgi:hypothetical protein
VPGSRQPDSGRGVLASSEGGSSKKKSRIRAISASASLHSISTWTRNGVIRGNEAEALYAPPSHSVYDLVKSRIRAIKVTDPSNQPLGVAPFGEHPEEKAGHWAWALYAPPNHLVYDQRLAR